MFRVTKISLEKYSAIVYSCSYESPISYLLEIENQVRKLGIEEGYILFDTLLSKGNVSNRFFEVKIEKGKFDKSSFQNVAVEKKSEIRKKASDFYRESGINLNNSLLTDVQKRIIHKGFVL
ncbi:TPA: type II toxin-antitoxin system RnlB family antitoxin [Streptococcus suis]|nr:hypothetical protein [Streptococcus suis]NQO40565.1 hypothetical protein [Streptococcus suis]NQP23796.1 hypothetical protein [Streptococcus suis]NQP25763.1 hypothetical protein [Streptococcus suis]HEL1739035.1 type II toxin-antitoxin system RnlB family antitoxin [Streptococcus suis]